MKEVGILHKLNMEVDEIHTGPQYELFIYEELCLRKSDIDSYDIVKQTLLSLFEQLPYVKAPDYPCMFSVYTFMGEYKEVRDWGDDDVFIFAIYPKILLDATIKHVAHATITEASIVNDVLMIIYLRANNLSLSDDALTSLHSSKGYKLVQHCVEEIRLTMHQDEVCEMSRVFFIPTINEYFFVAQPRYVGQAFVPYYNHKGKYRESDMSLYATFPIGGAIIDSTYAYSAARDAIQAIIASPVPKYKVTRDEELLTDIYPLKGDYIYVKGTIIVTRSKFVSFWRRRLIDSNTDFIVLSKKDDWESLTIGRLLRTDYVILDLDRYTEEQHTANRKWESERGYVRSHSYIHSLLHVQKDNSINKVLSSRITSLGWFVFQHVVYDGVYSMMLLDTEKNTVLREFVDKRIIKADAIWIIDVHLFDIKEYTRPDYAVDGGIFCLRTLLKLFGKCDISDADLVLIGRWFCTNRVLRLAPKKLDLTGNLSTLTQLHCDSKGIGYTTSVSIRELSHFSSPSDPMSSTECIHCSLFAECLNVDVGIDSAATWLDRLFARTPTSVSYATAITKLRLDTSARLGSEEELFNLLSQRHKHPRDPDIYCPSSQDMLRIEKNVQTLCNRVKYIDEKMSINEEDTECTICYTVSTCNSLLACGHMFCSVCLMRTSLSQRSTNSEGLNCPSCRTYCNLRTSSVVLVKDTVDRFSLVPCFIPALIERIQAIHRSKGVYKFVITADNIRFPGLMTYLFSMFARQREEWDLYLAADRVQWDANISKSANNEQDDEWHALEFCRCKDTIITVLFANNHVALRGRELSSVCVIDIFD